jgi:hypothetical protein
MSEMNNKLFAGEREGARGDHFAGVKIVRELSRGQISPEKLTFAQKMFDSDEIGRRWQRRIKTSKVKMSLFPSRLFSLTNS